MNSEFLVNIFLVIFFFFSEAHGFHNKFKILIYPTVLHFATDHFKLALAGIDFW